MIFNSLWPLAFLAAVPIIVILYLLKPKGKDKKISSNALWERLFRNTQSRTFFEKFVHNILMYVQILIALLLILALMAPFVRVNGKSGGSVVFLLDTSGSMQHDAGSGKTRFYEAVEAACDYVDAADGTAFTVLTCDGKTKLVLSNSSDKTRVKRALQNLACGDAAGNLSDAQSLLQTIYDSGEDGRKPHLIVLTDGSGAKAAEPYAENFEAEISVFGEKVSNVSLDYVSYAKSEEGFDVAVRITNYSDGQASMDVSIYEGDALLATKQVSIEQGSTGMCFFQGVDWQQDTLRAELSAITFSEKDKNGKTTSDSLAEDNISYAVRNAGEDISAVLIGNGNTYIEKAYTAVTGNSIAKAEKDDVLSDGDYRIAIYDSGAAVKEHTGKTEQETEQDTEPVNYFLIHGDTEYKAGSLDGIMLDVPTGSLTTGLSDFRIGVNETYYYDPPEWAESFIETEGKCIGYFGEHDGVKEVVLGFDLRESDFPLRAEFPVFIANVLSYLSDTSILAQNIYYPGETVLLNPSAEYDIREIRTDTEKAGLYEVTAGDKTEHYVVRFSGGEESDGRIMSEGVTESEAYKQVKIRKNLRNFLLVAALVLLVIEWLIYIYQMKYKGRFYLILRICGIVLLILALIGISIPKRSRAEATVFVVDLSESNKAHVEEISDYLKKCISDMPKNNQYGIVTFGKDSCVEQFLTESDSFTEFMTEPDVHATNFEEALGRAMALIPPDRSGRIVLLTDGKETNGNIDSMAAAVSSGEIELDAVLLTNEETEDAYIGNVTMPSYLHPNDEYSMTVTVVSNYDTDAEISFVSGSRKVLSKAVHLNKGTNQFVFKQTVTNDSMESFQVTVTAPGDTCEENNAYSVYSMVEAAPKVLVISGMDEDSNNFRSVLTAAGADFNIVSALNAPESLEEMLKYRCIILENVYIDDLPKGFLENLDPYVKDYGCGFICCGGEDSFALGGYRDTVIEDVLPVDMMLRGVNEAPSMAMVMVIDHSGSMLDAVSPGSVVTNLDIAIQAATGAVDNLRESDYVGVLTFDDTYTWQVPIIQATDREEIKKKIRTIKDGGGTTIKPALQEAYKEILKSDAKIKHIILLTDGMGETTDFDDLTDKLNDAGITLSTVAVGTYSDTRLLEDLAETCNGRYYYSDISTDIPRIFAQEVFLSGDTYIQNGDFGLMVASSNQLATGLFPDGWPNIYGYIAATPKQASTVVIASDKDDPILTTWQYGLGRTAAWNTDVTNEWTAAYAGTDDYAHLWKRIIDYTAGNISPGADSVDVTNEAGQTVIRYHTEDFGDSTTVGAVYQGPDGSSGEIDLICTAPGEFEAVLSADQSGIYNINVRKSDEGEVTNAITTAAAVQFSTEYRFDVDSGNFERFIQEYGRMITFEDSIWTKMKSSAASKFHLTEPILILLILLFVLDVALRRFQYVPALLKRKGRLKTELAEADLITETGNAEEIKAGKPEIKKEERKSDRKSDKKKKSGKKQETQTLDTSALLKKKEDRNL